MNSARMPQKIGLLIVDDEPLVRSALKWAMSQEGFNIWTARDGEDALRVYQRNAESIDVLLMDVCMPRLDGPHTLEALNAIHADVPCCFMSGFLSTYTVEDLYRAGAAHFVGKPFKAADVSPVLRRLAARVAHSRLIPAMIGSQVGEANEQRWN